MKSTLLTAVSLTVGNFLFSQDTIVNEQDTTAYQRLTTDHQIETSAEHMADAPAQEVYKIKKKVDYPLTIGLTAFTIYGFTQAYSKDDTPEATIRNLNVNNIPRFDRWAADVYTEKAAKTSDYIFYGSIPLPALLMLDKKIARDAAKIWLLYVQAMSVTGTLYTGSAMAFDRFRPYAYHPDASMGDKREGNAKNAFFAGHVALVGTATFFTAKVYADYHPESNIKWLLYSGAGLATATTAYLRHKGGRHFPSDILVGTAVGVLSGVMIPQIHKIKPFKNNDMSLVPFTGRSHGLAFTYRIR